MQETKPQSHKAYDFERRLKNNIQHRYGAGCLLEGGGRWQKEGK